MTHESPKRPEPPAACHSNPTMSPSLYPPRCNSGRSAVCQSRVRQRRYEGEMREACRARQPCATEQFRTRAVWGKPLRLSTRLRSAAHRIRTSRARTAGNDSRRAPCNMRAPTSVPTPQGQADSIAVMLVVRDVCDFAVCIAAELRWNILPRLGLRLWALRQLPALGVPG